ncbi:hypothetical protein RFI_36978, partial [Reticulomyxa filosa]
KHVEEICVQFNSSDIDWEQIVYILLQDKQDYVKYSEQDYIIIYHLDISSCVNLNINDFFFQLFFLQHIDTHSSSFHVNPNMVFFVELPSKFDNVQDTPHNVLYTLFSEIKFPLISVDKASNPFLYKEKAQYCLKWMKEYYSDNLKFETIVDIYVYIFIYNLEKFILQKPRGVTNWIWGAPQLNEVRPDYDPDKVLELSQSECETFMKKWLPDIMNSSILQQDMFFNYLYVQFMTLVTSLYLKNKVVFDHFIQYKHEATECAIDIAKDLY